MFLALQPDLIQVASHLQFFENEGRSFGSHCAPRKFVKFSAAISLMSIFLLLFDALLVRVTFTPEGRYHMTSDQR